MKTIKITTTRTYIRTAVVEIDYPNAEDGHPMAMDEVADYLHDNEYLYREQMDNAISKAEEQCDYLADDTRFDIIEKVVLTKQLWGGTL
jgi:hypothetical protein